LQKGGRVMLVLPNLPQLIIAFFGVLRAGGVAVFSMPGTEATEILRQMREAGAAVLITLKQFDELLQEVGRHLQTDPDHSLRQVILTDAAAYLPAAKRLAYGLAHAAHPSVQSFADRVLDFERIMAGQPAQAPEISLQCGELAVIQYTGGTTDRPKGVMLSHYNLVANALQTRHWIPDAREGQEIFLCALPFAHSYGLTTSLTVPIAIGATLVLKPRFEAQDILQTIRKYRASHRCIWS
jgi:long-chain acyl-CoA synthetase